MFMPFRLSVSGVLIGGLWYNAAGVSHQQMLP